MLSQPVSLHSQPSKTAIFLCEMILEVESLLEIWRCSPNLWPVSVETGHRLGLEHDDVTTGLRRLKFERGERDLCMYLSQGFEAGELDVCIYLLMIR